MKIGHDGAGAGDEFGPDSMWAYIHDNPKDDAAFAYLQEAFDKPEPVEPDQADWWKSGDES